MLNFNVKFLRQVYLIIMDKTQENALNETSKLLRRLKIVHSFSANPINNNNNNNKDDKNKIIERRSTISSHSSKNFGQSTRFNSSAFLKVPLPSVLDNKNVLLPSHNSRVIFNKRNNQNSKTQNVSNANDNITGLNKVGHRSFSTLGRFLSTPSGTTSQEFLTEVSQAILTSKIKRIVVMAGAGISCPSGIPDFRTPGSGLYDNLQKYRIPYPEAIFDIDYFMANPRPFFALAKDLFPSGKYRPNKVHYFFKLLQQKKLLLRVYTQNIDGLERLAGVTDSYLVEAHGTFASASCIRCGEYYSGDFVKTNIDKHDISHCLKCKGIVKPDIVFFGEDLPSRFHLYPSDFRQADLLLVMGTSLEVEPFASIVDSTRFGIPRVLLNRQAVGVFRSKRRINDHCILGDISDSIDILVKALRWESDLQDVMEYGEENQISFVDTISKSKPAGITRNFSTLVNIRRSRPALLPSVSLKHNYRKKFGTVDSSSESDESSSDSESSST